MNPCSILQVVLRLLGACGTTILFGIRLVIAEFLFGIMEPCRSWNIEAAWRHCPRPVFWFEAWAPVRAAGALLAAVPLVYTGRSNAGAPDPFVATQQEV